jgi:hypothetical protein
MEINRQFIHRLYQLDRQHCFAVYLRVSFQLLENICRRFPAIAKIELSKTLKTISGSYTDQSIKQVSLHTKSPTMKMPVLAATIILKCLQSSS